MPSRINVEDCTILAEHLRDSAFNSGGASGSSREYFSIIAAERMVASGLALPVPAISGAEPWIGSARITARRSGLRLPTYRAAADHGRLVRKNIAEHIRGHITSNWPGLRTSCMAQLSTIQVVQLHLRVFLRHPFHRCAPETGASNTLALSTLHSLWNASCHSERHTRDAFNSGTLYCSVS